VGGKEVRSSACVLSNCDGVVYTFYVSTLIIPLKGFRTNETTVCVMNVYVRRAFLVF